MIIKILWTTCTRMPMFSSFIVESRESFSQLIQKCIKVIWHKDKGSQNTKLVHPTRTSASKLLVNTSQGSQRFFVTINNKGFKSHYYRLFQRRSQLMEVKKRCEETYVVPVDLSTRWQSINSIYNRITVPKACLWLVVRYKYPRNPGWKWQAFEMKNLKICKNHIWSFPLSDEFAKERGRWPAEKYIIPQWIHTNKRKSRIPSLGP